MTVKGLNANQHIPLHGEWGKNYCCLCKAEAQIAELQKKLAEAEEKARNAVLEELVAWAKENCTEGPRMEYNRIR